MTASLYWYPVDGNGTATDSAPGSTGLIILPFSESKIGLIDEYVLGERQTEWPPQNIVQVTNLGARMVVNIRLTNIRDTSVDSAEVAFFCRLKSLERHLQLGGYVGFAQDNTMAGLHPIANLLDTAWAVPAIGDTAFYADTDILGFEASATLAANTIVAIESEPPEYQVQYAVLASYIGRAKTLGASGSIVAKIAVSKAMIRHRYFFPFLYLSDDSAGRSLMIRSSVGANQWTFEGSFVYEPVHAFDLMGETP